MTESDRHDIILDILDQAGVAGVSEPQFRARLADAGVAAPRDAIAQWLGEYATDAGYGRYVHPRVDPGSLPPARRRMRALLHEAGPQGTSGPVLLAALTEAGNPPVLSTIYEWLAVDAVKAGHGKFLLPEHAPAEEQLSAATPPSVSSPTQVKPPPKTKTRRQLPQQLPQSPRPTEAPVSRGWRLTILLAGLAVGLAGAALTASGLYAVALGCGVPRHLAWLYVLATDGLALVAYGATAVLVRGRTYAWIVVLVAAGLSGLAQAMHLAQGGGTIAVVTDRQLRFGVGYWPAVSTAVCAHLLWLVGRSGRVAGGVHQPVVPVRPEGAEAAVYRLYDRDGDLLYVGCTVRPVVRLRAHQRRQPWWGEVGGSEVMWFPSIELASRAEAEAVRSERPVYNTGLAAYSWTGPSEPSQPDGLGEPESEPSQSPAAGPCEATASPAGEPERALPESPPEPGSEPTGEPHGEPTTEPGPIGTVSSIRRQRALPRRAPEGALLDCDCGLARCPGKVSKAARTRHRKEVSDTQELASRAAQNGHREPVNAR